MPEAIRVNYPFHPGSDEISLTADQLRARVLSHLEAQGFSVTTRSISAPDLASKDAVRALHKGAMENQIDQGKRALAREEGLFLDRVLDGAELQPASVRPKLVYIDDRRSFESRLWRWCSLHWSIPVSSGYGRRLRFLVVDEGNNDAVIGLIGLGDPVFGLRARDQWIGWDRSQRGRRLTSVMDAFALGAVPPYNGIIGGKLVALLAGSVEVQELFAERYGHRTTLIADRDPHAQLAVVTTTSALGRSSIYNRLWRENGVLAMRSVGYTGGTGDFHFGGELYDLLVDCARSVEGSARPGHRHERWGRPGFRNRREVVQVALDALGFDSRALRVHGVKREIFVHETAQNSTEFLRGESDELLPFAGSSVSELGAWWKRRWALPRSESTHTWREFQKESWRLWETPR